jgi:hypothetical protein
MEAYLEGRIEAFDALYDGAGGPRPAISAVAVP